MAAMKGPRQYAQKTWTAASPHTREHHCTTVGRSEIICSAQQGTSFAVSCRSLEWTGDFGESCIQYDVTR